MSGSLSYTRLPTSKKVAFGHLGLYGGQGQTSHGRLYAKEATVTVKEVNFAVG